MKTAVSLKIAAANIIILIVAGFSADCAELTGAELEHEFAVLAARIPFINPADVVYQRVPYEARFLMDDKEGAALGAFMARAEAADESQLWQLTKSGDARVRTLGIIGVYWKGNPQRLPGLFALIDDDAKTFPSCSSMRSDFPSESGSMEKRRREWGLAEQTVGDIAKQIVGAYLREAHFDHEDGAVAKSFDQYWAERKHLSHCLSWFELTLKRATHGTTPMHKECLPAIERLRRCVDSLEPPYRGWIMLAITASGTWGNHDENRARFASGEDIARAAREIGPAALMDLFHGELKSSDPDLAIGRKHISSFCYSELCRHVLAHAAEIFKPADADRILALEDFHRSWANREYARASPRWAIAAADLDPKRAREILLAAYDRFKEGHSSREQDMRCEIVQAYWKHEGPAGLDFAKEWFFREKPDPSAFGFGRHRFAKWLGADATRRPLLKAIILDPRTDTLDRTALHWLIQSASQSLGHGEVSRWETDRNMGGVISRLREEFAQNESPAKSGK